VGKVKRNMPDPIPAMLIGRLAVDARWQGKGIGPGMLRAAIIKSLEVANVVGMQAIFVHALDEEAMAFYKAAGFNSSPLHPMTLMITTKEARLNITPRSS
jgi:predicted N-acetyltransferase YhbS